MVYRIFNNWVHYRSLGYKLHSIMAVWVSKSDDVNGQRNGCPYWGWIERQSG